MKHILAAFGLCALLAAPTAASALDHDRRGRDDYRRHDRHERYDGRGYGGYGGYSGQVYVSGSALSEVETQSYVRTGDYADGYSTVYGYGPYYPYGPYGPVVTYRRYESYGSGYYGYGGQGRTWGAYGYGGYDPYRGYDDRRYDRRYESSYGYGYGYGEPRPRPGYRDEWGYNDDRHPYRWDGDRRGRRHYDQDCRCDVYLRDD